MGSMPLHLFRYPKPHLEAEGACPTLPASQVPSLEVVGSPQLEWGGPEIQLGGQGSRKARRGSSTADAPHPRDSQPQSMTTPSALAEHRPQYPTW